MFKQYGILRGMIVLGVVLSFGCALVFAQAQTGEILGVVTDATGASVPGCFDRHRHKRGYWHRP